MNEAAQALGLKLKAERERRGLSTQRMANDMHLDEWVIDALEAGDHQRIGPAVFARGHLKHYASLLGVSESAAEPGFTAHPGPAAPVPILRTDPAPAGGKLPGPALAGMAVIALAAAAILWWRPSERAGAAARPAPLASANHPSASAGSPASAAQPNASVDAGASIAGQPTSAVTSAGQPNAAPSSARQPGDTPPSDARAPAATPGAGMPRMAALRAVAAGAVTTNGASPPRAGAGSAPKTADLTPGVGRARLRLSFSADSKVDIYDYAGRAIFTGNGRANSVKAINGIAPFRVYLGFASGVQLELNDRAVAIGAQFLTGDVARFEAGADGVLRRDARSAPANSRIAASPRG